MKARYVLRQVAKYFKSGGWALTVTWVHARYFTVGRLHVGLGTICKKTSRLSTFKDNSTRQCSQRYGSARPRLRENATESCSELGLEPAKIKAYLWLVTIPMAAPSMMGNENLGCKNTRFRDSHAVPRRNSNVTQE